MAQLIVPNAAQMRLVWSVGGVLYALNVLGVVNTGAVAITQALTNTIGSAIKAALVSSTLAPAIRNTIGIANVGLRDIRSANTAEFLDTAGTTLGTSAADMLPPQTALCITLRTAQAGRSFRGRVYLPGFAEDYNTAAGLMAGATGAVNFVAAIKSTLQGNGLDLGVIHRPTASPLPVTSGFITTVTSIVCRDLVWDTQRRRAIPGI